MFALPARAATRRFTLALSLLLALSLAGCAGFLYRDPVHVNVVGLEPMQGEGLEMRFMARLRVQNPNDAAIDYTGIALELDVNGKPFATGVSNQSGKVPAYGEAVLGVPVTVSAFSAVRQALRLAEGQRLNDLPYALRGKLAGGPVGGTRFASEGRLSLPGMGRQ